MIFDMDTTQSLTRIKTATVSENNLFVQTYLQYSCICRHFGHFGHFDHFEHCRHFGHFEHFEHFEHFGTAVFPHPPLQLCRVLVSAIEATVGYQGETKA